MPLAKSLRVILLGATAIVAAHALPASAASLNDASRPVQHVLLLSVDGLHAQDLAKFAVTHPGSALAKLVQRGVTYSAASSATPSDSFPGLMALITGGTPRSTGIYYDDVYARSLSAPGSKCESKGTEVAFDESIDIDPDATNGGGGIDPAKLPRDPAHGCAPVFPHQFLRVNTLFDVVKQAGGRTAWSDKHPAYDLVQGPSGKGVDDLFVPEIDAHGTTDSVEKTEAYDDTKVAAVLHEIDGKTSAGQSAPAVPTVFGMNFQAVSVAEKTAGNGYLNGLGIASAGLEGALEHTDASLGKLVAELNGQGLLNKTLIVLTAKHGQSPIDPKARKIVDKKLLSKTIDGVQGGLTGQVTADDVALIWLSDQKQTQAAAMALLAKRDALAIGKLWAGSDVALHFADPAADDRAPDLVVQPQVGVIYAKPNASKIAEHGGMSPDDTNVALVVAGPGIEPGRLATPVQTASVAPTILTALGLDPMELQAVASEHTPALPGLSFH